MKLATYPARWHVCFTAERTSVISSAGVTPDDGANVNSTWLGPNSTSSVRRFNPSACNEPRSRSINGSSSS